MTWGELCEKAQELGYSEWGYSLESLYRDKSFYKNGSIYIKDYEFGYSSKIAENRTPDQMYQIMLALRD